MCTSLLISVKNWYIPTSFHYLSLATMAISATTRLLLLPTEDNQQFYMPSHQTKTHLVTCWHLRHMVTNVSVITIHHQVIKHCHMSARLFLLTIDVERCKTNHLHCHNGVARSMPHSLHDSICSTAHSLDWFQVRCFHLKALRSNRDRSTWVNVTWESAQW